MYKKTEYVKKLKYCLSRTDTISYSKFHKEWEDKLKLLESGEYDKLIFRTADNSKIDWDNKDIMYDEFLYNIARGIRDIQRISDLIFFDKKENAIDNYYNGNSRWN